MNNRIIQLYIQNLPKTFQLQKSNIKITVIVDSIIKMFLQTKMRLYDSKSECDFAEGFKKLIREKYDYDIKDVLYLQLNNLHCKMDGQLFMASVRKIISKNSFINLLNIIIEKDYKNTDIIIDNKHQDIGHLLVSKKHQDFEYILIYKRLKDTKYVSKFDNIIKI